MLTLGLSRRYLIAPGAMLARLENPGHPMTDLIYIAAGFAVLGAFVAYAVLLKRV